MAACFYEVNKAMQYQRIRTLIAEGNLPEALEALTQEVERSKIAEKSEVILQSARLNSILKEKRIGVVTSKESDLVINQVTNGILILIDKLEKKHPATDLGDPLEQAVPTSLNRTVSTILGAEVSLQHKNVDQIQHLLKLYEIHNTNLQASEEAAAKWGELAPSIITHKLLENRQKMEDIKKQIASLI